VGTSGRALGRRGLLGLAAVALLGVSQVATSASNLGAGAADEPGLRIFAEEYVPNAEAVPYHGKWARAYPGEAIRWATFRDALLAGSDDVAVPDMATRYGKALVAAGKIHMSFSRFVGSMVGPPPTQPPTPSAERFVYTLGDPAWLAEAAGSTPGWWLDAVSSTGWTRDAFALPASSRIVFDDFVPVMQSVAGSYGNPGTSGPAHTVRIAINQGDPEIPGIAAGAQGGVLRPYPDLYTNAFFGPPPDARPQQGETWWYGFAATTNPGYIAHGQLVPDLSWGLWNSFGLEWHVAIGGSVLGPIMQEIHTMRPSSFNSGPNGSVWWTCNAAGGWAHLSPPRLGIALTGGLNSGGPTEDAEHTCRRIQGPVFTAGTTYKSIYRVKWDAFEQGEFDWYVDSGDGQGYVQYAAMTDVSTMWRSSSGPDAGTYPQLLMYRKTDNSLPDAVTYYGGFIRGSVMSDVVIP